MPIRIETEIPHKAEKVWAVVGTPDRIDWVNGVESCVYSDGIRRFKMDGAGDLAERILPVSYTHLTLPPIYSV